MMENKSSLKFIILLVALLLIFFIIYKNNFLKQNNSLIYEYKQSYLDKFYFKDNFVVFDTIVSVKNTTSRDIRFYMFANVSEDSGLVIGNTAVASKKDTNKKEIFFIKAKQEKQYMVYFKARKGKKNTKLNRLPPKKITFEIIK